MAYLLALRSNEIGEGEAQDMKLRVYHQRLTTGEWVDTVGYPCPLPHFPTQFAVVRPPSLNEETFNPTRWQVIHLHSGLRLSYQQLGSSKTRADAKRSALAEIERVAKDKGWKWTRAMILDTKSRPKAKARVRK